MNGYRSVYKTVSNSVATLFIPRVQIGIVFETATPFDTPGLISDLVTWMNEARASGYLHPLLVIGVFVVVFLQIHPFQDGNGRLSRILTTLLLLQAGYAYVPYSSLESVIEHSKESYYLALRQTQGTLRTEAPQLAAYGRLSSYAPCNSKSVVCPPKVEREKPW